jgi:ferritin-like metal-binding protein YciE
MIVFGDAREEPVAASADDLRRLFIHELATMYGCAQTARQMGPAILYEMSRAAAPGVLARLGPQVTHEIENLERCLEILKAPAQPAKCYVLLAVKRSHDDLLAEGATSSLMALHDLFTWLKLNHYTAAEYRGLIQMARMLGETTCAGLLEENLAVVDKNAEELREAAREISPQAVQSERPSASPIAKKKARHA